MKKTKVLTGKWGRMSFPVDHQVPPTPTHFFLKSHQKFSCKKKLSSCWQHLYTKTPFALYMKQKQGVILEQASTQCLKITEKSHSTLRAKRATFTKVHKKFGEFLKTWSLWSNSVTRHVNPSQTIIRGKYQNWKTQMRYFSWILNTVIRCYFRISFNRWILQSVFANGKWS